LEELEPSFFGVTTENIALDRDVLSLQSPPAEEIKVLYKVQEFTARMIKTLGR